MEQIKLNDINFHSLQKLKQQGTKAKLYKDGNVCFKILDGLYDDEKESLYKKFLDMNGIRIDNVLLPKELIVKDGKLQGYTMDYFPNSIPLSDRFSVRYVDSKILRTIHNNDTISIQDLILTQNHNATTLYPPEETALHQRMVNALASQVDQNEVRKEEVKQLRLRRLNKSRNIRD